MTGRANIPGAAMDILDATTFEIPSLAQYFDRHAVSPLSSVSVIPSIISCCLIRGIFTQLAAATAAKGTNLWISCEEDFAKAAFSPMAVPRAENVAEKYAVPS